MNALRFGLIFSGKEKRKHENLVAGINKDKKEILYV